MSASSDRRRRALVLTAAVAVAATSLLPIGVLTARAGGAPWSEVAGFLVRPRTIELLGHTVTLVLLTVPLALLLGIGCAWLVERTTLPWAGAWRILLIAPLMVPAFVSSYAWISLLPGVHGLAGAVAITTLAYYPFVFLPVAAMLRALDSGDEDVARSLGLTPWATFVRVVLPQLRPAIAGGALLVGLHLLAEFGVLEMMRFPTFTTAILQHYAVGFDDVPGSLLALVLVVLCLTVLAAEIALRGHARVARVGPGVRSRPRAARLGSWTRPAQLALTVVVGLALVVPVLTVLRWLVVGLARGSVPVTALAVTTATTIGLAFLAGLVTTAAALPAAWLLHRRRGLVATVLERVSYVASSLPGVVVGLALVTLSVRWARPLYQTVPLVVLAYAILFLPRALVTWRSGMAAAPPELSEASRSLGVGARGTFARVVLPLVLPSALTGFVLVFLAVSSELTATLLLAPTGLRTLATAFWAASDELDYVGAAPFAAMMIVLLAPLTLLLRRQITEGGAHP